MYKSKPRRRAKKKLPKGWRFEPRTRHNADWRARWQELFTGRDPAMNHGKVTP